MFWYDSTTAVFLVDDNATSLTFKVDGQIIGSTSTSVYWSSATDCGDNSSITVEKDLGNSKSKFFSYSIIDNTGWEYWSGTVEFKANSCQQYELD